MQFSHEEKINFLKAFTSILRDAKGKGPRNIYIKYFLDEIHVVVQGVVSDFEKYLIRNFGQEAIDTLTTYYDRDLNNAERIFRSILKDQYQFKFYQLESDFLNDIFVYKMKIDMTNI